MQTAAANAFLKTLEEPPADTTLFLLTTRPYDLLPTIRSRCFHLRLPATVAMVQDEPWQTWKTDYAAWLARLAASGAGGKLEPCDLVLTAYGLGARFEAILQRLSETAAEAGQAGQPPHLDDEELEAFRVGRHKGVRTSLLAELEQATRDFALADPGRPGAADRAIRLGRTVADLEKTTGLLEVNLKEADALEFFLLRSLRHWTAKN
jgi:DNA polymerase-3 subunit delta'